MTHRIVVYSANPSINQHQIQQLLDGAIGLYNRGFVIGRAGKVRVRERDPAKWRCPQNVSGRGLAVFAEVKSWRRAGVGVPPAVQDDSGDVAGGIET